ncbi:MAG: hypothetical protein K9W45_08785 [Candidatus Heimdallarchaeum aukensis]|uniref:ABC-2 type transporter domain-containing protein n=1 Tax=Candidatus Heimdallarchaeum aukensis TaxID=2876573 RepID=A0A9Y1BJ10_9ARCH|nr:MAG: hypothetical protein K9W45_08785 [Candidatus Heimdallarchaeum aukensis]
MVNVEEILPFFVDKSKKYNFFQKIKAIIGAKIKTALNYKSAFFMTLFLNIIYIFMFYFFGENNISIEIHGVSITYFQYAFVGLSLQMVVGTALASTEQNILQEIITGTWSSTFFYFNIVEYALGTSIAGIFLSSFSILISYVIATVFLKIPFWFSINFTIYLIILFFLIMLSYISISIFFSSFSIWYKKNIGITKMFYELTKAFTGITFPIILLKGYPVAWFFSRIMPLTYGLKGIYAVLFLDNFDKSVLVNASILGGFTFIIGVIGVVMVNLSLRKIRKEGSVSIY